ncbi:MAG: hypothetical protein CSA96_04680 [Bacteroidetes bacterium]|nr:MAG: hypothetical protein CSA96_04680 [Bacteroidota bacterium]
MLIAIYNPIRQLARYAISKDFIMTAESKRIDEAMEADNELKPEGEIEQLMARSTETNNPILAIIGL